MPSSTQGSAEQPVDTSGTPTQESSKINPLYAGLGAAAVSSPLIYKYLRTARYSSNPVLAKLQKASGGRYARTISDRAEPGALGKLIDKYLYDADHLEYTLRRNAKGETVDKYYRSPKKFEGAVHLTDPSESKMLQGTATSGGVDPKIKKHFREMGEDKWKEYQLFSKHAPSSMTKTENLQDIFKKLKIHKIPKNDNQRQIILAKVQEHLNKRYRKGFILKPTHGVQSAGVLPTHKDDFASVYQQYKANKIRSQINAAERSDDFDKAWTNIRKKPGFSGRVLADMLRNPSRVVVQEHLPISRLGKVESALAGITGAPKSREFRVHVINGQVVPELTASRYFHPMTSLFKKDMKRGANEFAQNIVSKLPKDYQATYGMDIAPLEGGGYKLIESNPGGSSGILHPGYTLTNPWQLRKALTGSYGRAAAGTAALGGGAAIGSATALGVRALPHTTDVPSDPPAQPGAISG